MHSSVEPLRVPEIRGHVMAVGAPVHNTHGLFLQAHVVSCSLRHKPRGNGKNSPEEVQSALDEPKRPKDYLLGHPGRRGQGLLAFWR